MKNSPIKAVLPKPSLKKGDFHHIQYASPIMITQSICISVEEITFGIQFA